VLVPAPLSVKAATPVPAFLKVLFETVPEVALFIVKVPLVLSMVTLSTTTVAPLMSRERMKQG